MLTQQLELVQLREAKALMQLDIDMMRAGLLVPATLPSARGVPDSTQADHTRVRLPGRVLMHSLSLQEESLLEVLYTSRARQLQTMLV